MPILLLVIGAALSLYCLWQLRAWLRASEATIAEGPRRLEALVDDLVATAEATVSVVEEKAEALRSLIGRADAVLARLEREARREEARALHPESRAERAAPPVDLGPRQPAVQPLQGGSGAAPAEAPAPEERAPAPEERAPALEEQVPAPPGVPPIHAEVYRLADRGVGVTEIARRLGMTKGEVQLILGLRPGR